MDKLKVICNSLPELPDTVRELSKFSGEHKIFAIFGKMGAGKTTFIKEFCKELGVKQHVSSPSFALVNEYVSGNGKPVYHFDFYRIKSETEAMDIGCEEYFYKNEVCLIEWPEKVLNLLPKQKISVLIEVKENEQREFTFKRD